MTEPLNFTEYILGPKAATRLRDHKVTQTIRSDKELKRMEIGLGQTLPTRLPVMLIGEKEGEKVGEYMKSYGWQIKSDPERWAKMFFDWGFTDGMMLGIDVEAKAARGIPL
jgi:hypothetical protein